MIGGRYRLRTPLGAGAMGEVWRADHVALGTQLALKLVDTANREDAPEILARFQQEARAAAQLRSPHVVQILDHGADDRVAFIAMELLEGESLERRLERRGRLTPAETAHVLREMARGIDRAHAAGIVHRDLKPPNVFLARIDGVEIVKVLDFGIAKFLGVPREAQLQTQAGFVVGTPAYMSPEQVLGKHVDHRSDLWQMAVIAFECVTGQRPFDGATLGQLFMTICTHPVPVPSAIAPAAIGGHDAAAFDAWFARGVERDPGRRFGSAGEMAEALCAIFAPGGVGEAAIATVASSRNSIAQGVVGSTGRNDAWSTGGLEARSPPRPVAFFLGMALAPLVLLTAVGLWYWHARAATEGMAQSAAPVPAPAITSAPSAAVATPPPRAASAAATTSTATPTASAAAPVLSASAAAPRPTGRPRRGGGVQKTDPDRIGL